MKEIWKDIKGYEGRYQVSNLGQVKNNYIILKSHDCGGYNRISLSKNGNSKQYLIHRLVYLTFNGMSLEFKGQKSKTLVCHKNDIKNDNRLDNLFLGTQADNVKDMMVKGRKRNGFVKKVKIGFEDVEGIKEKYSELKSIYKVADVYGVSYATISRVLNGKIWNR